MVTAARRDTYRVTVYYREPTYELVSGNKAEPYRWIYDVVAEDQVAAERAALREFDETARLSSVGWVRRIVGINIECMGAPSLDAGCL